MHFGALEEMGEAQYQLGLRDKLMGQVNLVLLGREYANDGAPSPSPAACSPSSRSASAVRRAWSTAPSRASSAAQPGLPRGLRINAVSPTVVSEALPGYAPYRGFKPVPAADAALGYTQRGGAQTGQVYRIW